LSPVISRKTGFPYGNQLFNYIHVRENAVLYKITQKVPVGGAESVEKTFHEFPIAETLGSEMYSS
jgi:hypothetical protein